MKRIVLLAALAALAGPARADIDVPEAAAALALAGEACGGGQALWGVDMCGPMLLADPRTRKVVANRPGPGLVPEGGVFTGVLPAEINIANTAMSWNGTQWTMVVWPLPRDVHDRRQILMHEAWHRVQAALGFPMSSVAPGHLNTADGRIAMRMEWRALSAALAATEEASRRRAISDALTFRAWRASLAEGAAEQERLLEMNEGLAEWTGWRLSGHPDLPARLVRMLAGAERRPSYSRSFAYATGPAYGVLLDRYDDGWHRRVTKADSLPVRLKQATGVRVDEGPQGVEAAGLRYGLAEVRAEERAAFAAREQAAAAWRGKLVDGPVLHLPFQEMKFSFDPNTVVPLPPHGTVYPSLRIVDAWGVLEVESGGALIDPNFGGVAVPANGQATTGPGWKLELNPGWRVKPGRRPGDATVEPAG